MPGAAAPRSASEAWSAPSTLLATPARLHLLTNVPVAFGAYEHDRTPILRLDEDAVGYLDGTGSRALATLEGVRHIPGPPKLSHLCVADDGKTTFAGIGSDNEATQFFRAERFDAPLELLGTRAIRVSSTTQSKKNGWIVHTESDTVLAECATGKVERVTGRVKDVNYPLWSKHLQVLSVKPEQGGPEYCVVRTAETPAFAQYPNCVVRRRKDGFHSVEKRPPEPLRGDKTYKPPPPVCLLVVDQTGKSHSCTEPEGPEERYQPRETFEKAPLALARHYTRELAVVPGPKGGLFRVGPGINIEAANRIGPESLGECAPLLTVEPVFSCTGEPAFDVVVRVTPNGTVVEELRRPRPPGEYPGQLRKPRFNHTADGGLAVGGDCTGSLNDAACVRTPEGRWQTVAFSKELVSALTRTAPATRLIPRTDGRLYLGTGTIDGGLAGGFERTLASVQILIFRADRGGPTTVRKLPAWILEALSRLRDEPNASSDGKVPDLGFSTSEHIRAWPLQRRHPAFGTAEHCRVDIALQGSFETSCVQGRLSTSGRFGLLQKNLGEIYETIDAGSTWTKLRLPKGLETDDITCTPLGCRIGPYFRAGWGEPGVVASASSDPGLP